METRINKFEIYAWTELRMDIAVENQQKLKTGMKMKVVQTPLLNKAVFQIELICRNV